MDEFKQRNLDSPFDSPTSDYLEMKEFWYCPKCKNETLQFEHLGCWD
jgi:rubredoxin